MKIFFSKTTNGFYLEGTASFAACPEDAHEITKNSYLALIQEQEQGKIIQPDENGYPVAVVLSPLPEPEPPTEAEFTKQRIAEIQQQLTANDLASVRPLRAKVSGTATEFDETRLVELEAQAQALRAELATLNTKLQELSDQTTE